MFQTKYDSIVAEKLLTSLQKAIPIVNTFF